MSKRLIALFLCGLLVLASFATFAEPNQPAEIQAVSEWTPLAASDADEPAAPDPGESVTPDPGEPETPDPGEPETPDPGEPSDPGDVQYTAYTKKAAYLFKSKKTSSKKYGIMKLLSTR